MSGSAWSAMQPRDDAAGAPCMLRMPAGDDEPLRALAGALGGIAPLLAGPSADWPPTLRTALDLVLQSPCPMAIWWSTSLIQFYNDAFGPLLGADRHPDALGRPAAHGWAAHWSLLEPVATAVMTRGERIGLRDFAPGCGDGPPAWYDCGFSPIRDETGAIAGVLVVAHETTARVLAQRRAASADVAAAAGSPVRDAAGVPVPATAGVPAQRVSRPTVLVADPDPRSRAQIGRALAERFDVAFADDAAAALDALSRDPLPEVVIADAALDAPGSVRLLAGLRGDPRTRELPVIAIAAPGAPQAWNDEGGAGIDRLVKPIDASALVASVDVHVRHASLRRVAGQRARQLAQWDAWPRDELASLIDGIPAATVVAFDPEFRDMIANRAACALLRLQPGSNVSFTAPGRDPPAFRFEIDGRVVPQDAMPMRRAVISGEPVPGAEVDVVYANGERVNLLGSALPLFDAQGRVRGCLGVFLDLTARRIAEAQLREADRRKDVFLATLSHELRNPLAPIRNAVAIMRRLPAGDARLHWCQDVVDRQVAQLSRLLDDLLDLSRIRWGRIALQRAPVPLAPMLAQALEISQPLLDECRHRVVCAIDGANEGGGPIVDADAVRLTQVFSNLLNNAAKYTPAGGRIELGARADGEQVVVTVADNGDGLEPEQLARIFEPFGRDAAADADRRAPSTGLGIGLSLVRGLVELHGGRIAARSDGRGKGSVFEVRLPRLAEAAR